MVARGNIQARQRLLEERLTGLDPRVLSIYERMHARELALREKIRRLYSAYRVNQIPDAQRGLACTSEVRQWLREGRVFAFIHGRHFWFPAFEFSGGQPKAIVRDVLRLIQPAHGWEAMYWFVGANAWLESGAPADHMDRNPDATIEAASHFNDLMSD